VNFIGETAGTVARLKAIFDFDGSWESLAGAILFGHEVTCVGQSVFYGVISY
jgi:hypothetical protein